jgi:hypothetical protein
MTLDDLIIQASKKCELFANPLRSYIAAFISAKEEVTWSELKGAVEKWAGHVNPNTLSFHLGGLMNAGYITKIDVRGQPRYRIMPEKLPELKQFLGQELLQAVKEHN